jgi:hypothetical protein
MSGFIHGSIAFQCASPFPSAPIGWLEECEDCAYEAWERMTYGGVTVVHGRDLAKENSAPPFLPPYTDNRYEDWSCS